ncbi:HD domain-containing protein [Salinimicrobium flavum]|uniref:HD domain-containing protein n=1 Tax=Salinimicrobium flavum TaxID=1737065 RepID=A0ABW5IUV5_9FLAO
MEEEALEFARNAHEGQLRKYIEEPYIEHPKRVAEMVRRVPHNSQMICAAYLHDVVEDTPISVEDIREKFGKKIALLVEELTDEYLKVNYPHLNRRRRKDLEVRRQANISPQAQTIKLADIIDNTRDIIKNDRNFARRYIPELEALTEVLLQGDSELLELARKEIKKAKEVLEEISEKK